MAVVGGVGGALLIPNLGSVFGASNAANVAGTCATPSATSTAAGATATGTAAAAVPSASAAATVAPTPSGTAAAPVATAPAAAATTAATATAAATTAATTPATAGATASAAPTICPTATGTAAATAAPTATAPAAAAANVSCDIIVPANPLSAQGLSTPYQLTGTNGMSAQASGCTMANFGNLGAFVQATILDPATGKLSVYEPLVITQGTQPAATPVVPTLPAGAVVTIDFGFNGTNLTQVGATRDRAVPGPLRERAGRVHLRPGVVLQRHPVLPGRAAGRGGWDAGRSGDGHGHEGSRGGLSRRPGTST